MRKRVANHFPLPQTKAALDEVAWARAVFEGRRTSELGPDVPPLADVLAATGSNVTWSEFQRWVSLVASYAFHLPDDAGTTRAVFLPLLDLLNHGDADVANCDVAREGGAFVARATKPIKAGEEVSFSYSCGQARPDHQFMHYGFLNRLRRDAPHLACVDLFNKTLWDCPAPDDAELGKKGEKREERGGVSGVRKNAAPSKVAFSCACIQSTRRLHHGHTSLTHSSLSPPPPATPQSETEAARLQAILDGFTTTEEDDLVAAQSECRAKGGMVRPCHTHAPHCAHTTRSLRRTHPPSTELHRAKDWRKAMIMEFRATRKRALRLAIARFSGKAPVEGGHSEL